MSAPDRRAVLLMDLQVDFLDPEGRMPVDSSASVRILDAANRILAAPNVGLPVLVSSAFSPKAWLANAFRCHAALAGSPGARLDPRLRIPPDVTAFTKSASSAFSNPALAPWLREQGVSRLVVWGVFAEGCVRATALDARRLGFEVCVPRDLIGTNARWKHHLAVWALQRGGVEVVDELAQAFAA